MPSLPLSYGSTAPEQVKSSNFSVENTLRDVVSHPVTPLFLAAYVIWAARRQSESKYELWVVQVMFDRL